MTYHVLKQTPHSANKKIAFNKDSTPYTCPELKRNPGLSDDRFDAFRLPSRIGNQYIYPKKDYS